MTDTEAHDAGSDIRKQARERVEKRRDFKTHVFIYLVVNATLVAIWAIATPDSMFWPIFPILGWGIGVAAERLGGLLPSAHHRSGYRPRGTAASRRASGGLAIYGHR